MPFTHRRLLALLVTAAVVLLPALASAQVLEADLDGDGVRDRIERRAGSPDVIIRLSRRPHPHRLRLRDPIVQIATVDFDHDGDADIVATTGRRRLHIWLNQGSGQFRTLHPRRLRHDTHPRAKLSERIPCAAGDNTCDGASIGLTPPGPVVRHPHASAVLAQGACAPPIQFRSRGSAPRGPPSIRSFS